MTIANGLNVQLIGTTGSGNFVGSIGATLQTSNITSASVVSPTFSGTSEGLLTFTDPARLTMGGLTPVVTIKQQTFISSGTYTPSTGMLYAIVEIIGGGGGGGGSEGNVTGASAGGGGGGGGYTRALLSSSIIGVSQSVVIGIGGAGGIPGNNNGSPGITSTFGSILTATGGFGGFGSPSSASILSAIGANGGVGGGGDLNLKGNPGNISFINGPALFALSGNGGSSFFGGGADASFINNGISGATNSGGGGSGGASTTASFSGGTGGNGICYITEFCNQ